MKMYLHIKFADGSNPFVKYGSQPEFEELYKEYPKCKVALQWWCNCNISDRFNISRNRYLKEFIIKNHPHFQISNKCCKYAKKDVIGTLIKRNAYDLEINGVRRAEGGIRDVAYKICFDSGDTHSKCYTEYGLRRTGCAGCPYGRNFENELRVIKECEPKLYKAVNYIFGDSYEYTRRYREFIAQKNTEQGKE